MTPEEEVARVRPQDVAHNNRGQDNGPTVDQIVRQIYEQNVRLAQLADYLASLPVDDPRRQALIAASGNAQEELLRITGQMNRPRLAV